MNIQYKNVSFTGCFALLFLFMMCSLTSCIKREVVQGYSFTDITDIDAKIASIKPNKTGEIEVLQILGSPSAISNFGPDTFFYISRKMRYGIISNAKLLDQRVLAITFNKKHIVESVSQYNMQDRQNIPNTEEKVEFKGNELGIIEQFSRNIGKFNKKK